MRIAYPHNFFMIALALAVAVHFFVFESFLLEIPSRSFPRDKGLIFLGSILNSSQMQRTPDLKEARVGENAPFSFYIPPRSEREHFAEFKDFTKPGSEISGRKNDVKSLFLVNRRAKPGSRTLWQAEEPPAYQPLTLPDNP